MKFCLAEEMRRLDEKTIKECGLPGVVLMENAGRGAAGLVRKHLGELGGRRVAVVCGRGNNGGDGFVMGRVFHGWGAVVRFYLLSEIGRVGGDARVNLEVARKMGLEIVEIREEAHLDRLDLAWADLIVDAVFGTGLNSEVKGLYRAVIEIINGAGRPVVAVDVPSGLDADTGRVLGVAVGADLTVTFGLPKAGLLLPPGEQLAGRLEVVDIGIPPHVLAEADPRKELLVEETLRGLLRPRPPDSHKGAFGHVLIVAGSTGKTGAAAMAALAAARSGAGLVTLAVPTGLNPILEAKVTEPMTEPLPEEAPGFLAAEATGRVLELAAGKTVLALGPGLSTRPGAVRVVRELVEKVELPLVIDADGLNALAREQGPVVLKKARREVVLTPHPGEMSRLAGLATKDIQADRLGAAAGFAREYGVILVLKGHRTVVAAPDGRLYLNTTGGPHLASGGQGDVLTGLIAGLIAQGLSALDAARLGVFVHGLAADQAAAAKGPVGLLASDLLAGLPGLWSRFIGS
ncbi:MAG: NAD(P)H-hydrate dehydratase [Thermodesulfobacteriota bacterium]